MIFWWFKIYGSKVTFLDERMRGMKTWENFVFARENLCQSIDVLLVVVERWQILIESRLQITLLTVTNLSGFVGVRLNESVGVNGGLYWFFERSFQRHDRWRIQHFPDPVVVDQ